MFTNQEEDSIRALGESQIIEKIREWLGDIAPPSPNGMGDDCALVQTTNGSQILTTDSLTYGQHFDDCIAAKDAGAKLIKRNLSDIAAMGGQPAHALLTLLCGSDLKTEWLQGFISGVRKVCEQYDVSLVGGDLSSLPAGQFVSALSLTGVLDHAPLLRQGARAGDLIYLTGSLGGSLLGKHYTFEPRIPEGQWLARSGACTALMDLTDGLAKDLRALVPAGCAASLDLDQIPLSPAAIKQSELSGKSPLEHAFCDGEDYELLFAVSDHTDQVDFESQWARDLPDTPLTQIGRFKASQTSAPSIDARTGAPISWTKGFEHITSK